MNEFHDGEVVAATYGEAFAEFDDLIQQNIAVSNRRFVCIEVHDLPPHQQLLDLLGRSLAESALMLWPEWYGSIVDLQTDVAGNTILPQINQQLLSQSQIQVRDGWFRSAVSQCSQGAIPWNLSLSPTAQVRELSQCLANPDLCIHIRLTSDCVFDDRLDSLARAVEWMADETQAAVVLSIPRSMTKHPAFSRMRFLEERTVYSRSIDPFSVKSSATATTNVTETARIQPLQTVLPEERKHIVQPLIGRPHPASPGEQKLAEALENDAELTNLFCFNQPVTTIRGNRLVVDLIWVSKKVVVEVDGYGYHRSRDSFSRDRDRDYQLLISGYVVLRLPHDEVVMDVQLAVEKIRDVVRWRKQT